VTSPSGVAEPGQSFTGSDTINGILLDVESFSLPPFLLADGGKMPAETAIVGEARWMLDAGQRSQSVPGAGFGEGY
jgi:hypothetical protein